MDPNSHAFNMFAQSMPGYYTPTPGGTSTLYHSRAGDLHTPSLGAGMNTPLSLPTSESILHAGQQNNTFQGMNAHMSHQIHQQFTNFNPFQASPHPQHPGAQQQHHHAQSHQPQTFAPHQFTHQPSYDHLDSAIEESPMGGLDLDMDLHASQHTSPELMMHPQSFARPMLQSQQRHHHPTGDKFVSPHDLSTLTDSERRFRWHATLNAPTAMIKHSDEIPITYLNKGQAYTLNVVDTHHIPQHHHAMSVRYRTFVRISFEDEQQRQRPAACWQLWKEGRGTNEAHQRGGRLQAVEYVPSTPSGSTQDPSRPRMELESSSFDGFCVLWSPVNGSNECPISVRFNFLSTDFSHSKGVKGIPVRLCAKTQIVSTGQEPSLDSDSPSSEVCYCKVKLFRDHGAERKLSNDIAHVKKSIDKLNQQIAQLESGQRDSGKRKRSGSIAKTGGIDMGRPGKVMKHRRTWSMSSITSSSAKGGAEEDLHIKLGTLSDMFTSTRPASVLYLRGAEEDDPDLHPVQMTGDAVVVQQDLKRIDSVDSANWESSQTGGPSSSLVSPTPSHHSLSGSRRDSNLQQPTPFGGPSRVNSSDWRGSQQPSVPEPPKIVQQLATPLETAPVKVQTRSPTSGTLSGWVEATGVDHTYQPPEERAIKPVACFYVQPRIVGQAPPDNFYRAVYLMQRSLKDFNAAVASKCHIDPTKITRTYRIKREGPQVLFDDECIRELPEGQDMTAQFSEVAQTPNKPMREWDLGDADGDLSIAEEVSTSGYELQLLY